MRVFVTGINGYLGGWLCAKLEDAGHIVIGMDSHGNNVHITKGHEWKFGKCSGVESCKAVIALGWYSSVGDKHEKLQLESQERTIELIDKIKKDDAHFIFASSAAVYGNHNKEIVNDNTKLNPQCAYSRAKTKVEDYIEDYLEGRHTTFRFGSLMGIGYPGTRTKSELVVNAFAVEGYKQKRIELWNPLDYKPVIHVIDAAKLIVSAVDGEISNGIYNACQGSFLAIDLARCAASVTRATVDVIQRDDAVSRSCRMECSRLWEIVSVHNFKRPYETIFEFENYTSSPNDKNTPWIAKPIEII